jgi:hypothetical protein
MYVFSSASSQILYFTNGHLYPAGSKADQASLLHHPPTGGVATLKLTDVRPSDTGTYLCHQPRKISTSMGWD